MTDLPSYTKHPDEITDYGIDFADNIQRNSPGDTITSGTFTVHPVEEGGVTLGPDEVEIGGTKAKTWVSGGVRGRRYIVTLRAPTAEGRTMVGEFAIYIPKG